MFPRTSGLLHIVYGYTMHSSKSGSSHCTFRKPGKNPIIIPSMKTIEYYMNLPYKLEIIPDPYEGGYVARYPDLPGCVSVGNTIEAITENTLDAKKEWLAAAMESGTDIAEPVTVEGYSGQFKLRLPKSLHRKLAEHSKEEGVSMNQYCVYLLSKNDALEKV